MKYSIVFKGGETNAVSNSLFIKLNAKAARELDTEYIVLNDVYLYSNEQCLLLFQSNNVLSIIQSIRTKMNEHALSVLHYHSPNLSRRKDNRFAVQNYIDDIGVIVHLPVALHSDYFQQKNALVSAQYLPPFTQPNFKNGHTYFHHELSLTALYIINAMKCRTDNVDLSTYITCAELSRMTEISPEIIKRELASPSLKPFVQLKKVERCKTQTLEFTDDGKRQLISNEASEDEADIDTKISNQDPFQKTIDFPLKEYAYHNHLALMRRLTEEYKKVLNNTNAIPEIKKEAALAFCLMEGV
ncbi:hypothetical protein HC723_10055 [Vibrio sp. S11_S32]|uniref:hypothetical protein n=1 Tax=Vibrio sp. S11_S32 TaxID=2720225 RepID=UPI001680EDBD|nr:hypothetical protein [Vibrio sp. S11_S32]MBD1576778.1 hypothetical protein [Vibrio sp. S11_S32]